MNIARSFFTTSLWIGAFVLSGCATASSIRVAEEAEGASEVGQNCTVPAELDDQIRPGKIILIGEVHGTVESPAAFGKVVCRAVAQGYAVSVGLEFDPDQAEPLVAYLASDGSETAVTQLLQTPFWKRTVQDGRSSSGMLRLVEQLRILNKRSARLRVFVLEEVRGGAIATSGSMRDQNMAARVRAERRDRPEALILTLTGNFHNRLKPMNLLPGERKIPVPMGTLLVELLPLSVTLETTGGSAWACMPACGVQTFVTPTSHPANSSFSYQKLADTEPYNAEWWLGQSTASLPASQLRQ